jgi:hypothetical protein
MIRLTVLQDTELPTEIYSYVCGDLNAAYLTLYRFPKCRHGVVF